MANSPNQTVDSDLPDAKPPELSVHVQERRTVLRQELNFEPPSGKRPEVTSEWPQDLVRAWLIWQCRMIAGTVCGVMFTPWPDSKDLKLLASWPDAVLDGPQLAAAAESSLWEQQALVHSRVGTGVDKKTLCDLITYPVVVDGKPTATVVVQLSTRPEPQQRAVQQLLQWGIMWLEVMVDQKSHGKNAQAEKILDIIAAPGRDDCLVETMQIVVEWLAMEFDSERVSIGFCDGLRVRLKAMSHNDGFDPRTQVVHSIEAAMEEVVDQSSTVVYPAEQNTESLVNRAHCELSETRAGGAIFSVPLVGTESAIGALTLERDAGHVFEDDTIQTLEKMARYIGPILHLRLREERSILSKAFEVFRKSSGELLGAGHLKLKFTLIFLIFLVTTLALVDGEHRVTARASLEGAIRRIIVAPQDGYIKDAKVRAGDLVVAGQILASLDSRDLELERQSLSGKQQIDIRKYQQALANSNRVEISILRARLAQVQAQLELVDEKLGRVLLLAPFDGVVVSGDLSHSLGSPVTIGQTLFEVAPLKNYRVVLKVEEQDVARLQPGQKGKLVVAALPQTTFDILVDRIVPVALSDEGQIYYRVEAALSEQAPLMRPGMQGIAKLTVGQRSLLWIWTHKITDKLGLWTWSAGL